MTAPLAIGTTTWFDLQISDVVDARLFYEGLFGWKFLLMNESAVADYWVIQAGQQMIGGIRKTTASASSDKAPVLYFTVDNIERFAQRIKDLGGQLVGDCVNLGLGRGMYQWFRDRESNLLALWAPSKEAI